MIAFVNTVFFGSLRAAGLGVMAVKELNDMETASVDIEMDVPGLKIRSTGLPGRLLLESPNLRPSHRPV